MSPYLCCVCTPPPSAADSENELACRRAGVAYFQSSRAVVAMYGSTARSAKNTQLRPQVQALQTIRFYRVSASLLNSS